MTKPYVKLRESGKVVEVESIDIEMAVTINNGRWGRTAINTIDCDLCDEQGRLLVPQDPRQAIKDELLRVKDDYIQFLTKAINNKATFLWSHRQGYDEQTVHEGEIMRNKITELESKLREEQR